MELKYLRDEGVHSLLWALYTSCATLWRSIEVLTLINNISHLTEWQYLLDLVARIDGIYNTRW